MSDEYLSEYCDLPGVRGGRLKGPMRSTVTGFREAMVHHRAVSAASDYGAVMVWQDDCGTWFGKFMRHRATINDATFASKREVSDWLKIWLPKMREQS